VATDRRRKGFTLIELLLAIVIVATALVMLSASMTGGIATAGDAINQRAAREACRALLEQAVASGEASGGGVVPGHEQLSYNITRSEQAQGATESPEEKYDTVTVTVTYPSDNAPAGPNNSVGTAQVSITTFVDPPDLDKSSLVPFGTQPTGGAPPKK
jgi:prepilin-type N-terminal cleavage/methylation domain-containing protein